MTLVTSQRGPTFGKSWAILKGEGRISGILGDWTRWLYNTSSLLLNFGQSEFYKLTGPLRRNPAEHKKKPSRSTFPLAPNQTGQHRPTFSCSQICCLMNTFCSQTSLAASITTTVEYNKSNNSTLGGNILRLPVPTVHTGFTVSNLKEEKMMMKVKTKKEKNKIKIEKGE